jgi:NAD(P) transhydrogenase subunit beta
MGSSDHPGIAIGGGIGAIIAKRIAMTAMPQLVAGFPQPGRPGRRARGGGSALFAAGLRHRRGGRSTPALIEMALGVAIGAITFTGSIIAFPS